MSRPLAVLLALCAALAAPEATAASSGERWHPPLADGVVVGRFAYDREAPFAGGGRRGLDVAAPPGSAVRAACAGLVTHAGRVPQRGLGVTVRCRDGLVATHLGLARVTVRRGAAVAAGTRIGALGPTGRLRLGARQAADRFGYVDPARLLRPAPRRLPPLGPAPRGRRTAPPRPPALSPPAPAPSAAPSPHPPAVPALAWAGLALVAAGATAAVALRPRRRARRAASCAVR